MADPQVFSVAALTADSSRRPAIYHDTISARSREEAVILARESIRDQPGRTLRSPVSAVQIPEGGAAAAALVVDAERHPTLYHKAFPTPADQAKASARSEIGERYPGGAVHGLNVREAPAPAGGLDVAGYAGQVIDSFESARRHMEPEVARSRTISTHAANAAELGRASNGNAAEVARSVIANYSARVEEGYPAGEARADAVRNARDWYNERGQQKQERGTMDVREFSSRVIDEYRGYATYYGEERARGAVAMGAADAASAVHGVHVMRAGRIAEAAIDTYNAHRQQGASHETARDTAAGEMGHRYDERGHRADRQQDRPQERQRSRGAGMSL